MAWKTMGVAHATWISHHGGSPCHSKEKTMGVAHRNHMYVVWYFAIVCYVVIRELTKHLLIFCIMVSGTSGAKGKGPT